MLNTYLSIFDLPGGYERAARERAKAGKGKGGLQFGGIQSCLFFQSCFQRQDSIILIFPQGPVGPWSAPDIRYLLLVFGNNGTHYLIRKQKHNKAKDIHQIRNNVQAKLLIYSRIEYCLLYSTTTFGIQRKFLNEDHTFYIICVVVIFNLCTKI